MFETKEIEDFDFDFENGSKWLQILDSIQLTVNKQLNYVISTTRVVVHDDDSDADK